eukprot:Polyplicarium_translucidae@DN3274_c18_g1_i1.p2
MSLRFVSDKMRATLALVGRSLLLYCLLPVFAQLTSLARDQVVHVYQSLNGVELHFLCSEVLVSDASARPLLSSSCRRVMHRKLAPPTGARVSYSAMPSNPGIMLQ